MSIELKNAEQLLQNYAVTKLALGLYDPLHPRRPRLPGSSFEVEFTECDEESRVVHAAGPVVIASPAGNVERHLRLSIPYLIADGALVVPENAECRVAYVEMTNPKTGACREAAALANC